MTKTCPRCKADKSVDDFALCASRKDGRQAYCRACLAEIYALNREARRSNRRDYYLRNREAMRDANRKWRAENPDAAKAANRASEKAWREANPDERRAKAQRYRARKHAAWIEDVHPLVVLERDDGVCGICGRDVDPAAFDIDHVVPLARGGEHSYANVQIAHPTCNKRKWAHLEEAA
jgi:5-methylcytosine-specific restriction endonuclease McrA